MFLFLALTFGAPCTGPQCTTAPPTTAQRTAIVVRHRERYTPLRNAIVNIRDHFRGRR